MSILKAIFGGKEKQIQPDQIEILFHTEAAYFGEHGRMIASNKELGIVEKPVIFCLKGFTTPLPLNHRMFAHIWNSALADGWIPLEIIKYGSVIEKREEGQQGGQLNAQRELPHLVQGVRGAQIENAMAAMSRAAGDAPQDAVVMTHRARSLSTAFSDLEVPAYMRKQAGDDTGFESAGFQQATAG